ncbi:uncharacterized protein LOC142616418 [Castanea sativa]|uniref:uncharacterized protein LOC142616418 n=1 Tax=Castanea sativa TaxID=21020 RepID=UPI003F65068E
MKCAFGVSARKFLGFLVQHKGISVDLAKAMAIATMKRPTTARELKSFLGRVSYIRRTLKNAETKYPKIEKACLVVIYTSQRQIQYFSTHQILLVTKSHPIRALLHQPLLTGRIAQWLVLLSQYDIGIRTPKAAKSQAIVDLLAQFLGSEECSLSEEIPREVAVIELPGKKWTMRFDGSTTATSNGLGIVLSCEDGDTLPLSFKLGFSCSNNAAEYEAYLTRLTIAIAIGVKHMRVLGDSNLVVSQVK